MLRRHASLVVTLLALSAVSCAEIGDSEPSVEGDLDRECEDGLDNDGDGTVDCDDNGCSAAAICVFVGEDTGAGDTGRPGEDTGEDTGAGDTSADSGDTAGDTGDTADGSGSADTSPDTADTGPADTSPDSGDTGTGDTAGDSGTDTRDTGGDTGPGLPYPVRSCTTTLRFDPPGTPASVAAAGEWNGFSTSATPLSDPDRDGVFEGTVDLDPGEYGFKYVVDGVWEWDAAEAPASVAAAGGYTKWVDGSENRALIVADCQKPALETVRASSTSSSVEASFQFIAAADGIPVDPNQVRVTVGKQSVSPTVDAESGEITVRATGLPTGKHSIRVWASDENGVAIDEEPHFVPLWVEPTPFVWQDATMYFVFTDRFRNGDYEASPPAWQPIEGVAPIANYQGGDFLGVIDAIEEGYFDELGVNLLWLSPVYDNPEEAFLATDGRNGFSGFHGYWPISGRGIENRWGDAGGDGEQRLKELIDAAHARGIRVMFDLVLNHVHNEHEYRRSHPEWFSAAPCPCTTSPGACNWDTNPIGCWFTNYLPDLDYKNHEVVRQISADVEYFVTEFDVDSFRMDAAKHMDHVIMRRISNRLEQRFEQGGGMRIYTVGETFTGQDGHGLIMDYVSDSELIGQFDFPLMWPIRDAFAGNGSFRSLAAAVQTGLSAYGAAHPWMSPFLGNHDIPRFSQVVYAPGGIDPWAGVADPMTGTNPSTWNVVNRMSLGFAFVLTQPGIPLIYYGDEIGLYGGGDPDNRRLMKFGSFLSEQQARLLSRVQAIGQARRDSTALRRGSYRELWVDDSIYVYARDNGGGDVAIVAFNKGGPRSNINVNVTALGIGGASFRDALGGPRTLRESGGNVQVSLNDWEYAIFVRSDR
jgi:glycosidase